MSEISEILKTLVPTLAENHRLSGILLPAAVSSGVLGTSP